MAKQNLPKKTENISDWYTAVIQQAELSDYGPVKGTMIFRPYGYALWENIQAFMDIEIKKRGVENAYFPLFIPESFLKKEKDHVAGFAPELAVVTHAGGEELSEKIIVRPTSETIMYDSYSKWIQSWRDLPLLINQWNNVVRWEKRTFPFLRTSEFLWQEGHTVHATSEENTQMQRWAMDVYKKTYEEMLALPGIIGYKSETEKFAGAVNTLTFESLMPDGKALQSCTSHDLGQNFSKVFDISFQDKEGQKQFAWQTSWGFSTRSIGGMILSHGDDNGLVIPPAMAPIQVVILPIRADESILNLSNKVVENLKNKNIRVRLDNRDDESVGFRINKWELKGVPIRIEIGVKEVGENKLTVARRDTGEKIRIDFSKVESYLENLLQEIQNNLFIKAQKFLAENTYTVDSYDAFKNIMSKKRGFIKAFWCEDANCELKIKEETKATTRCLPIDSEKQNGKCIYCSKKADYIWVFAQSY